MMTMMKRPVKLIDISLFFQLCQILLLDFTFCNLYLATIRYARTFIVHTINAIKYLVL